MYGNAEKYGQHRYYDACAACAYKPDGKTHRDHRQ
jgi:hypothetical protein